MSIQPWVTVDPPDDRGLRKITVGGKTVGSAWSFRELCKILNRLGYTDMDFSSFYWRGGDSKTWPDKPWRRRAIVTLMTGGMVGSAILHLSIGWPDALRALTFAQRIVGAIFILAGVLLVAAALAAHDYWGRREFRPSGMIALTGALITLATDTLLLIMWLEEREYTPYLIAFIPLSLWSLWALCLLIREKPWKEMPHPTRFAAGVAATALLTAVSLAYSTMYQPTSAPIDITLKAEFGTPQTSPDPKYVHVPLKLHAKNDGGIPVYILNSDYTVRGSSVSYSSSSEGLEEWTADTEYLGDTAEAQRHASKGEDAVVASGHFYYPGAWLEIGEQYAKGAVIRIPRKTKYDTLEVSLSIDIMRKDRGRIDEEFSISRFSWEEHEGEFHCPPDECRDYGPYVAYHGRVHHNNNLINVTRRPRYVTAFWGPESTYSHYISSFDFKKKTIAAYDDTLFSSKEAQAEWKRERYRYGVGTVDTYFETPINALLGRSSE
ncbi:hypothetical protein [Streptomyces sp. SID5643]|uniref:hypothetical protein n=1 Tax=Streptomyces sp. SID5643 TaxID=2690307 RepID=UPI001367E76D|nr:hypothetical protein [Streptomyces sp. SID5643]MZF87251.1 hypothetical protein [Streptomyces sp. SID5643]